MRLTILATASAFALSLAVAGTPAVSAAGEQAASDRANADAVPKIVKRMVQSPIPLAELYRVSRPAQPDMGSRTPRRLSHSLQS